MHAVTLKEATLIARKVEHQLLGDLIEALEQEDVMGLAELVAFQNVTPQLMERALDIFNDPKRMEYEDPYAEIERQNCAGLNFSSND